MKAILVLEDGTTFEGISFGASGEITGEVVFNTSMTGYQEILTDPSYKGQIVTMTYPLIGNYGTNKNDTESTSIQVEAFIVKELCKYPSSFRSEKSLENYLKENNIIGIEDIDTRALTKHIRLAGAMKGIISTEDFDENSLLKKVKKSPNLVGRDLVKEVTCTGIYSWEKPKEKKFNVVAIDCGIKHNILRELTKRGCMVTVVSAATSAGEILNLKPDGVFLSNGPGDPAGVPYVYKTVKELIGKIPIFGICLGHQMLSLALGGKTYKLKFGHRGANHPVKDLSNNKIEITVQNHGFCADIDSLSKDLVEITHINLNDNTCEGIKHKKFPAFSVQHHPEASAGPHDSMYHFDRFIELMEKESAKKN